MSARARVRETSSSGSGRELRWMPWRVPEGFKVQGSRFRVLVRGSGSQTLNQNLEPGTASVAPVLFLRPRPHEDEPPVDFNRLLGYPIAHVERVRDDAHAGLELLLEFRNELQVQARQQIQRDDRRIADVGLEEILVQETD